MLLTLTAHAAPATFTVNTLADTQDVSIGDGICADSNGECSLRAAIQEANGNNNPADTDIINIPAQTYTIGIPDPDEDAAASGDFDITQRVNIVGAGAATTIIQGWLTPSSSLDRVFHVLSGAVVEISGVTIRNGYGVSSGSGIYNAGTLTLASSTVSGNSTSTGGIYNSGTLTLTSSTVSGNTAEYGGGIYNAAGTTTLNTSTVSGNTGIVDGGGIYIETGTVTVNNSTVSGNNADALSNSNGGGIYNKGALTINSSTVSGNSASNLGGGILNYQGMLTVTSSTISGNSSFNPSGIFNLASATLTNTIIASTAGGNCANDKSLSSLADIFTNGYNLSSDTTCQAFFDGTGDQNNADPVLGPLQDNGGTTLTHALLASSPAIDAGSCSSETVDQIGQPRPIDFASVTNVDDGCDVGAFEKQPNTAPVAVNDSYTTHANTQLSVAAAGVLSNDNDANGDPLEAALVNNPANGSVTLNTDGSFIYTPNTDYVGADSFTYQADDGLALSNLATVSINVTNATPVASDDTYYTFVNTQLDVAADGVLGNDNDNDGDTLTGVLLDNVTNGTLTLNGDGSFSYVPNTDYIGMDSFTYQADDGVVLSNVATVRITVAEIVTTFNVNTTNDTVDVSIGDGVCADFNGECSLRAAIQQANGNPNPTDISTINVPAGTYTFAIASTVEDAAADGDLDIAKNVDIIGAGAATTIIQAAATQGTFDDHVFHILSGAVVEISGVTIRNGSAPENNNYYGGGIYNAGTLTLTSSTISGNGGQNQGGGIWSDGTLTVRDSTISGNSATSGDGGGIWSSGTLTITSSIVSGNSVSGGGGGIWSDGPATVTGSTVSGNSASENGGIYNVGTLTVTSSTISGNSAESSPGIYNGGTLTVTSSTISSNSGVTAGGIRNSGTLTVTNSTISGNSGSFQGGGIINNGSSNLTNTVITSALGENCINDTGSNPSADIVTNGYNLSSDTTCSAFFDGTGDQNNVDPLLGSLADNGGATRTHALLTGSPAIDAGNCPSVTTDQNGQPRPADHPDVTNVGDGCDIGAFEYQPATTFTVNTTADTVDANTGDNMCADANGLCSLRAAVQQANGNNNPADTDTINVPAGTYTFSIAGVGEEAAATGDLDLAQNVNIVGGGASATIIQAAPGTVDDRVFHILSGAVVEISGVTIQNGSDLNGGGIYNAGTLTVTSSTISGNSATSGNGGGIWAGDTLMVSSSTISGNSATNGDGGGIWSGDTLTVSSSTISGNSATVGGGILNNTGAATVSGSTVSGNSVSSGFGGGITNFDTATVSGSTISGNSVSSGFGGGGIFNDFGTLTVSSSTISGNSASSGNGGGILNLFLGTAVVSNSTIANNSATSGGGIYNFNTVSLTNTIIISEAGENCLNVGNDIITNGYNLSSDTTCSAFFDGAGDQNNGDPMLGPLQDNGGPTLTHSLLVGSPAINAGDPAFAPPPDYDQRGVSFPRVNHGQIDIGAYEWLNAPPVATDNSYVTPENTALNVAAAGVLTDDTDADGQTLTAVVVTTTSNGTLSLNQDGSFDYTPDASFGGIDSFTYQADDGYDLSNIATVTIAVSSDFPSGLTVSGENVAPVLPTFSWVGVSGATNYRVYVQTAGASKIMDETFSQADICQSDVVCAISDGPDAGDYSSIPAWGLTNDSYQWWVGAQLATGWAWSGGMNYDAAPFDVMIPAPLLPDSITVNPGDGRIAVYFPDDANTLWVNLWIGPHPAGSYYQWLSRDILGLGVPFIQDEFICDGTICVAYPAWDVPSATGQTAWMQAWGPGGFSEGGTAEPLAPSWNQMSATVDGTGVETPATTFDLPADTPTAPTNIGVVDATVADPGITWLGSAGTTWYNVVVYDPTNNAIPLNEWYVYQDTDLNCTGRLTDPADYDCELSGLGLDTLLSPNTTYQIWMRSWGPGGFGTGATDLAPNWNMGTFTYNPA